MKPGPNGTLVNDPDLKYITLLRNQMRPFRGGGGGGYPPDTEFNHIGPDIVGPLAENWGAPCPRNLTRAEQEVKCVSVQQAVWGAATLRRLKKIKLQVDTARVLNCNRCVGDRGPA